MALAFARRAAWLLAARAALALVNIESRTPNSHFRTAARRGLHTGARRATLLGMAQIDEAPRTLSKDEIIALALRAGFEKHESYHLSGNSEDDELLSVGEYPVGESVLMLAELIQEAIKR